MPNIEVVESAETPLAANRDRARIVHASGPHAKQRRYITSFWPYIWVIIHIHIVLIIVYISHI